jgi:hypothetical protein
MPLAKIAEINGLPRAEVAAEVTAFLAVLEADFAERTELTRFLISYLSGGDSAMPETQLAIRYAAASDIGREREHNQDTAYITQDHSVVQSLIDAGRLTPEEAWSHPQRALLLKAFGAADADAATPDLSLHDARPGDRYLLCSDGLTSVVPAATIRETLTQNSPPEPRGSRPAPDSPSQRGRRPRQHSLRHRRHNQSAVTPAKKRRRLAASCCYQPPSAHRARKFQNLSGMSVSRRTSAPYVARSSPVGLPEEGSAPCGPTTAGVAPADRFLLLSRAARRRSMLRRPAGGHRSAGRAEPT